MRKVFIGVLNWGLGHATRMCPIIDYLIEKGEDVHIGSDGRALLFLQNQYPQLKFHELPGYDIVYSGKSNQTWTLIKQLPKLKKVIKLEHQEVEKLHQVENFDLLISDNRLGIGGIVEHSIYITHQLTIQVPFGAKKVNQIHHRYIKTFSQCWVPDYNPPFHISGRLGATSELKNVFHIGPQSHLKKLNVDIQYAFCFLLSGPEPQRSLLEELILSQIHFLKGKSIIIRGVTEGTNQIKNKKNYDIADYLVSNQLSEIINRSEIVIGRSGYSSIMDLLKLEKKVFFVPTPGQTEQEYLAKRLKKYHQVPFSQQHLFSIDLIAEHAKTIEVKTGIFTDYRELI